MRTSHQTGQPVHAASQGHATNGGIGRDTAIEHGSSPAHLKVAIANVSDTVEHTGTTSS